MRPKWWWGHGEKKFPRDHFVMDPNLTIGFRARVGDHREYEVDLLSGYRPDPDFSPYRPDIEAILIANDHFEIEYVHSAFSFMPRTEAVAIVLSPLDKEHGPYAISRVVPPGGADRFHVVLAAVRSGYYTVRITFDTDAETPTASGSIRVRLRRDRNSELPPRSA
jgi:hypothetical protein